MNPEDYRLLADETFLQMGIGDCFILFSISLLDNPLYLSRIDRSSFQVIIDACYDRGAPIVF